MSAKIGRSPGWKRLGIIAGDGMLPVRIAEAEASRGAPAFVVRLTDEEALEKFSFRDHSIAEVGAILKSLQAEGCDAVCFAGIVRRPNFAQLKPDWRGAALLPRVVNAARRGDGAIIDVIVEVFEKEGFQVVGAEEAAGALEIAQGSVGAIQPSTEDFSDIRKAASLIEALGPFDVGQGAVVRRGFVLAIEAAEGTDAMLARCAALPASLKGDEPGTEGQRSGVLVKVPKPEQELRVDMPTIGAQTVRGVCEAGLAGIAVRAGRALVIDHADVRDEADRLGVFVYAFSDDDLSGH
ncbi:MAG: UDP-2,3-diacylglucosamine diphosphatase LpxI [Pseudomonadota bacterium]